MTSARDIIALTSDPLSLDGLLREIGQDAEGGALVTFSGIVRATEGPRTISHLDYESYDSMARRELEVLVANARERWPLLRVGLLHRKGCVPVGEPSVLVAVLAGHRAEAFEAARYLIDELKRSVPIWKSAPTPPTEKA